MKVAVVDYGAGNLRSVAKALDAAGADAAVVGGPGELSGFDALCVPGQGIFGRCLQRLADTGFEDSVRAWIDEERPYLGICLGLQVLMDESEEGTGAWSKGLGIIGGRVERLRGDVTIPHIGWNEVTGARGGGDYYYFDHSFAVLPDDDGIVNGWCEHGLRFAASIERGPLLAVQFHPEKSGEAGIRLLKEWVTR